MTTSRLRLAVMAGAVLATALAAGSARAGASAEAMAATCAGCHGTDGASQGPATPTIASLSTEYFVLSMKDYKSGKRPSTVMGRIAKGYSDEDFAAMAKVFQAKPFVRVSQTIDADKVKHGKPLAKKYCESCHEDEGRAGEGVGVMAGQMLPYMRDSITDFLSGKREMERRQKQKYDALIADHGKDAFDAILSFYASQK